MTGVERLLRLCLAYYSLGDPNPTDFGTRQSLFAKNVSPKHFLNAQTFVRFDSSFSMHNKKRHPKGYLFRCGRDDRSRTCGIHVPNVARYHLRYISIFLTPNYYIMFCFVNQVFFVNMILINLSLANKAQNEDSALRIQKNSQPPIIAITTC